MEAKMKTTCNYCGQWIAVGSTMFPLEVGGGYIHLHCAEQRSSALGIPLQPPVCKHWQRRGFCFFAEQCFYLHPPECRAPCPDGRYEAQTLARQVPARPPVISNGICRKENRGPGKRNVVKNRFRTGFLRRFLLDTFGREVLAAGSGVLDVAGGNGSLAFELVNLNGIPATVVDPRPLELRRFQRSLQAGFYHKNLFFRQYIDRPTSHFQDEGNIREPVSLRMVLGTAVVAAMSSTALPRSRLCGTLTHPSEAMTHSMEAMRASANGLATAAAVSHPPCCALPSAVLMSSGTGHAAANDQLSGSFAHPTAPEQHGATSNGAAVQDYKASTVPLQHGCTRSQHKNCCHCHQHAEADLLADDLSRQSTNGTHDHPQHNMVEGNGSASVHLDPNPCNAANLHHSGGAEACTRLVAAASNVQWRSALLDAFACARDLRWTHKGLTQGEGHEQEFIDDSSAAELPGDEAACSCVLGLDALSLDLNSADPLSSDTNTQDAVLQAQPDEEHACCGMDNSVIPLSTHGPTDTAAAQQTHSAHTELEHIPDDDFSGDLPSPVSEQQLAAARHILQNCSVLVGMHPDQAAEYIFEAAQRAGKPFAMVPCCVYSGDFPKRRLPDGRQVKHYEELIQYYVARDPVHVKVAELAFEGRNKVVYCTSWTD